MLAGRQFFCERFSRGWKAERTMNRKHLLFIEFKHALYLYKLEGIFHIHCLSLSFCQPWDY